MLLRNGLECARQWDVEMGAGGLGGEGGLEEVEIGR